MKILKVLNERGYPVSYYNGLGWKLTRGRYYIFVDGDVSKKMFISKDIGLIQIGVVKGGTDNAIFVEVTGILDYVYIDGKIEDYMEVINLDTGSKARTSGRRRTSKKKASAGNNKGD